MKITSNRLRQIIREETTRALDAIYESEPDDQGSLNIDTDELMKNLLSRTGTDITIEDLNNNPEEAYLAIADNALEKFKDSPMYDELGEMVAAVGTTGEWSEGDWKNLESKIGSTMPVGELEDAFPFLDVENAEILGPGKHDENPSGGDTGECNSWHIPGGGEPPVCIDGPDCGYLHVFGGGRPAVCLDGMTPEEIVQALK
tara:strand:+ start:2207 stop:2809 length:603 start_codon:yes stop_codon:yes gene_type:complete